MEINIKSEEHSIATEETCEIVFPQPVLAYTDTNESKKSVSLSNSLEIEQLKQSEEWRKATALITEDSMIAVLREVKLSSNKKTKVQIFLGGKTEDLMFHLIDNIIIHIGTNNAPYKSENALFEELKKIKELIITQHPNCKNRIFVSPAR